jgi:hypothetical protein
MESFIMANLSLSFRRVVGVLAVGAAITGPFALFEATQPGHSVNKYYRELHQSPGTATRLSVASVPVAPPSAIDAAPTIVIPETTIVADHHRG